MRSHSKSPMKFRKLCIVAAVALLPACASTPKPLPTAELQAAWSEAPNGDVTQLTADGSAAWWHLFGDPVLDELIQRAEARNLDLRSAEASVQEARASRAGARSALLPQFNIDADFTRGRPLQLGGNLRESASIGPSVNWEIDLFGRLRSQQRAEVANLLASESDRDAVRLTVLAEVARSYLEYRLYRVQQSLAEKTVEAQARTARITQARFSQGMGSRLDVERSNSLLATIRAAVPQAHEQAESAFHRLVRLTASTPEALATLLPHEVSSDSLPTTDALSVLLTPTQVLGQRPDVRAAERRLVAAAATLDATRALRYPQLTLSSLIGVGVTDTSDIFKSSISTWSVNAGLLTPLFDFGRIRAAIDVADARQEQAYLAYESSVRGALQETQTAIVLYTQGQLRQTELGHAADAARKAAAIARTQYAQGLLSMIDVLDAERSLYDAERDWSSASADVSLRLVTLYQTMGVVPSRTPG